MRYFTKRHNAIIFVMLFVSFFPCKNSFSQFGFAVLDDDPLSQYKTVEFWSKSYYNRVEGFFAHAGTIIKFVDSWQMASFADAGYGLKNRQARYEAGLEKRFGSAHRLIIKGSVFDKTFSNDEWMVGQIENSLAGIFLHEDFRDYFGKKGWRVFADKKVGSQHLLRLEYSQFTYRSMRTNSNFAGSLFGKNKKYRPNPAVPEGEENAVQISFLFDKRDNPYFPLSGWFMQGSFETTGGDFNTNGLFVDATVFQPTVSTHRIVLRTFFGLRQGSIQPQHLMTIGGVGSLRAYRDRIRSGQNFFLASLNYEFGGSLLQNTFLRKLPLLDTASFALFADVGDAWSHAAPKNALFDELSQADLLTDVGLSFLLMDGFFRIDVAKALAQESKDWRITFRLFNKY